MIWNFRKHVVMSIMFLAVNAIVEYILKYLYALSLVGESVLSRNSAASIAIIGGADGPTAIFGSPILVLVNEYGKDFILFIVLLLLYWPFTRFLQWKA
jgi:hypothetical protein